MGVLKMATVGDSSVFSSTMYLPIEKWEYNFGADKEFVMDFMARHDEYMIERYLPPNKMQVKYALTKNYPPGMKETIGFFDGADELVVMLKLMS